MPSVLELFTIQAACYSRQHAGDPFKGWCAWMVICCMSLAGAIAYSGPFMPSYRSSLLADWTAKLVEVGLPHSPHANLIKTLADPVQVRQQAMQQHISCSDSDWHISIYFGVHMQHTPTGGVAGLQLSCVFAWQPAVDQHDHTKYVGAVCRSVPGL